MSVAARIELEKKVVRGLIRHMKAAGWSADNAWDGESEYKIEGSESKAMEAVFGVDEISLRFKKSDAEHGVLIVLGNDGWDAISDWNYREGDPDGFNASMDAYVDKVSAKYG